MIDKNNPDTCDYNPDEHRAAYDSEESHGNAAVILGRTGEWRLCASCAILPEFKKYKVRKPIAHNVGTESIAT